MVQNPKPKTNKGKEEAKHKCGVRERERRDNTMKLINRRRKQETKLTS